MFLDAQTVSFAFHQEMHGLKDEVEMTGTWESLVLDPDIMVEVHVNIKE